MSKENLDQVEILTKIQKLRAIADDVEYNGIHNPHSTTLLEIRELELKEELEKEMRQLYVKKIDTKIEEYKKLADRNFERDQPTKCLPQGGNND
jgi:hypothetical protein